VVSVFYCVFVLGSVGYYGLFYWFWSLLC
jgi:hypothetical protein